MGAEQPVKGMSLKAADAALSWKLPQSVAELVTPTETSDVAIAALGQFVYIASGAAICKVANGLAGTVAGDVLNERRLQVRVCACMMFQSVFVLFFFCLFCVVCAVVLAILKVLIHSLTHSLTPSPTHHIPPAAGQQRQPRVAGRCQRPPALPLCGRRAGLPQHRRSRFAAVCGHGHAGLCAVCALCVLCVCVCVCVCVCDASSLSASKTKTTTTT